MVVGPHGILIYQIRIAPGVHVSLLYFNAVQTLSNIFQIGIISVDRFSY